MKEKKGTWPPHQAPAMYLFPGGAGGVTFSVRPLRVRACFFAPGPTAPRPTPGAFSGSSHPPKYNKFASIFP